MPGVDRECVTHHNACGCHMAIYRELLEAAKVVNVAVVISKRRLESWRRLQNAIAKTERIIGD